jgi:hypothetical protein
MKARMTLDDGITPGAMRHGAIHINALIEPTHQAPCRRSSKY